MIPFDFGEVSQNVDFLDYFTLVEILPKCNGDIEVLFALIRDIKIKKRNEWIGSSKKIRPVELKNLEVKIIH